MVMHARKPQRMSDGFFEKHQAHPYQSKYNSKRDYERETSNRSSNYRDRDNSPSGSGGNSGGNLGNNSGNNVGNSTASMNNGNSSYRSQSPELDSPPRHQDIRDRSDRGGGDRSERCYIQKMRDRDRDVYNKKDKYSVDKRDRRGGTDRDSEHRTNHDRIDRRSKMCTSSSGGVGGDKRSGSDDRERDRERDLRDSKRDRNERDRRDRSDRGDRSGGGDRERERNDRGGGSGGGGNGGSGERTTRIGDWSEHVSSSGKMYYYNCKTEVSQWEKPKEWLEKERSMVKDQHREREYREKERERDREDRFSRSSVAYTKHSSSRGNSRLRWPYEIDSGPPSIHRRRHEDNPDMDISPGDSTPTSEASYSLTGTPTTQINDVPQQQPHATSTSSSSSSVNIITATGSTSSGTGNNNNGNQQQQTVLLANALPRLASHPQSQMHFNQSVMGGCSSSASGNVGNNSTTSSTNINNSHRKLDSVIQQSNLISVSSPTQTGGVSLSTSVTSSNVNHNLAHHYHHSQSQQNSGLSDHHLNSNAPGPPSLQQQSKLAGLVGNCSGNNIGIKSMDQVDLINPQKLILRQGQQPQTHHGILSSIQISGQEQSAVAYTKHSSSRGNSRLRWPYEIDSGPPSIHRRRHEDNPDMDISPGDSTPTSEASYSLTGTPTTQINDVPQQQPHATSTSSSSSSVNIITATGSTSSGTGNNNNGNQQQQTVLLANALPRLASHPQSQMHFNQSVMGGCSSSASGNVGNNSTTSSTNINNSHRKLDSVIQQSNLISVSSPTQTGGVSLSTSVTSSNVNHNLAHHYHHSQSQQNSGLSDHHLNSNAPGPPSLQQQSKLAGLVGNCSGNNIGIKSMDQVDLINPQKLILRQGQQPQTHHGILSSIQISGQEQSGNNVNVLGSHNTDTNHSVTGIVNLRSMVKDQHREREYREKERERDREDRFSRSSVAYTKHSSSRGNSRLRWPYEIDSGPPSIHRRRHEDNPDMDISPGDSTPTSEASYSLTGTPTTQINDVPQQQPHATSTSSSSSSVNIITATGSTSSGTGNNNNGNQQQQTVLLANALPRLASHPQSQMHFNQSVMGGCSSSASGNVGNNSTTSSTNINNSHRKLDSVIQQSNLISVSSPTQTGGVSLSTSVTSSNVNHNLAHHYHHSQSQQNSGLSDHHLNSNAPGPPSLQQQSKLAGLVGNCSGNNIGIKSMDQVDLINPQKLILRQGQQPQTHHGILSSIQISGQEQSAVAYTKHSSSRGNSRLRWPYEIDSGPPSIHRRRHEDNPDMDISPGDSTPTSEASYSLTGTPTTQINDVPQQQPHATSTSSSSSSVNIITATGSTSSGTGNNNNGNQQQQTVLLANALPRLASHPQSQMHFNQSVMGGCSSSASGNVGNNSTTSSTNINNSHRKLDSVIQQSNLISVSSPTQTGGVSLSTSVTSSNVNHNLAHHYHHSQSQQNSGLSDHHLNSNAPGPPSLQQQSKLAGLVGNCSGNNIGIKSMDQVDLINPQKLILRQGQQPQTHHGILSSIQISGQEQSGNNVNVLGSHNTDTNHSVTGIVNLSNTPFGLKTVEGVNAGAVRSGDGNLSTSGNAGSCGDGPPTPTQELDLSGNNSEQRKCKL